MSGANVGSISLGGRVARGTLWGAINMSLGRIVQFVTTLIVARILAPEHFGALAIALVVQTVATNMAELGATASLARGNGDPDKVAPTVFTIALATSTVLTVACIGFAPALAALFGDPGAAPVIQVMSLTILLQGIASVPSTMVWREFLQKPRVVVDLANLVVVLVLVVPMANAGWGAMALAWSRLGGQAVATIGYWIITPKRYHPGFDRTVAAEVLRLGMPLALANLVVFVTLNLDYLFIGRLLGPVELGLYLMAFNLAGLPSAVIMSVIRTVAVPAFGRLHERGALGRSAGTFVAGISFVAFPISAMLVALGLPFISTMYGLKWAPAAVAMAGLGIFGAAKILAELFGDMCVGGGKTVGLFWVQVAWLAALAPALYAGVNLWGIAGAGAAHAVVAVAVVVPAYLFALRPALNIRVLPMMKGAAYPALTSTLAGIVAWSVALFLPDQHALALVLGGVAGLAVYALLGLRGGRRVLGQLRTVMSDSPAPVVLSPLRRILPAEVERSQP